MRAQERYRFKIANMCDWTELYNASAVTTEAFIDVVIGTHTFVAGDYVLFEGFDPYINGYRVIDGVTATTVYITTPVDPATMGIDTSLLGTVKKIPRRIVRPLNFFETKFDWQQEKDEIFFRKALSGSVKFVGEDFNYFRDYILPNECCEIKFIIEKRCGQAIAPQQGGPDLITAEDGQVLYTEQGYNWVLEWQGYFAHNSCKWDFSHCNVEASFDIDDYYRCLFYGYEDKKTIFDTLTYFERLECCNQNINGMPIGTIPGSGTCAPPCSSITSDALSAADDDRLLINFDQVIRPCDESDFTEWQLEKDVITQLTFENAEFNYFSICTTWIREVNITIDVSGEPVEPAGVGWILRDAVNYNGLPAHKWTRLPYGGIYNVFSAYTIDRDCMAMPCARTWTVNFPDTPDSTTTQKSLPDVLELLTTESCGSLTGVRSDFFEINPPGDTPGYVAGTNYVTGLASQITNLRVQQISAFITVTNGTIDDIYSDMSLKDCLDSLKVTFNCKWFVDIEGYIRIEHISWFLRNTNADSTIGDYNIRINKGKKQFTFDRLEIPLREKFEFVYQGYRDFIGKDIKYNSYCVNIKKTVTYNVVKFSTDLLHVRNHADDFNDFNSFLLLACDGDDVVMSEVGFLTGESQLNGHLSWANLHENFYRHDRYLISGNMNDIDTTFETAKKIKRQIPILYTGESCCKQVNPLTDLVTTELGDGQIDKMSKDNRGETFTFELLF